MTLSLSARRSLLLLSLGAAALGCGADQGPEEPATLRAELKSKSCPSLDAARSILVTDAATLASFSLEEVLSQMIDRAGAGPLTPAALYQQWWDTQNDAAHALTNGPHCDDPINGFPVQCPRQEGALAATDPFAGTGPDTYVAIALSNRFDLAPADGAHCGDYGIAFAKRSGLTNTLDRNLISFDARLPNPYPERGIAGCSAVASFWAGLSSDASTRSRAKKLHDFYFVGLPGFEPVVDASHYAGSEAGSGGIRTNQFMDGRAYLDGSVLGQGWQLRQFALSRTCGASGCSLVVKQSGASNNPYAPLFSGTDPLSRAFRQDFLDNQLPLLVVDDLNRMNMRTSPTHSAAESSAASTDYTAELAKNPTFEGDLRRRLDQLGRPDLDPGHATARATTQTCSGCHQLSNDLQLGGGTNRPQSNGFTHIDEDGTLSPALTEVYLPYRRDALARFVCGQ